MQNEILGLYDIYTVHHVPLWQQEWYLCMIASCICGAAWLFSLIVAFIFYKKALFVVYQDPWLLCVKRIELLCPKKDMSNFEVAFFYDNVTSLLKDYLCMRYGIAYYDATDHDIYTKYIDTRDHLLSSLAPVFQRSSMVKFARESMQAEQLQKDYDVVHHFILSTKPSKQS